MDLVTIKAKTRGKNTREVEYQGIGKFVEEKITEKVDGKDVETVEKRLVTAGVLTDINDILTLTGGDMQKVLDFAAIGYNLEAYKSVSDALAEFVEDFWTETQVKQFRLSVNALKAIGMDLEKAVEMAKSAPALQKKAA